MILLFLRKAEKYNVNKGSEELFGVGIWRLDGKSVRFVAMRDWDSMEYHFFNLLQRFELFFVTILGYFCDN